MSPRSLLFCSNRETSQILTSFLRELRFEVEHCPEIFGAVERLTSHSHEVIIIDWDEGMEAAFLLKSARELESNCDAFVIAVAKPESVAAVRQAGANEVVVKPPLSEIRNGLVSGRDFLAGLERRLEAPRKAAWPADSEKTTPPAKPAIPAAAVGFEVPEDPEPAQVRNTVSANLSFASFDNGLLDVSRLREMLPVRPKKPASLRKIKGQRNPLLRLAAMVVAFFTVGYVSSQPLSKVGDSVAEIYQAAWGIRPPNHHSPRVEPPAAQLAEASFPQPADSGQHSVKNIEVTPLYNDPPRHEKPAGDFRKQGEPALPSDRPPAMASAMDIPTSLTSQFPGGAAVRNVAERISPAILGAFEPVNLPGYLSEKLLLQRVEPSYPEKALQAGLQGPVVLQAWIGRDGKVRDLKLIRGPLLLGQAAYKAVKQWRYQPYLMNGEAVEAQTYVTVDFKLP